jgi:hypothetical protein
LILKVAGVAQTIEQLICEFVLLIADEPGSHYIDGWSMARLGMTSLQRIEVDRELEQAVEHVDGDLLEATAKQRKSAMRAVALTIFGAQLALALSAPIRAQAPGDALPTAQELKAISQRGRMLADYDRAAHAAADAVRAIHPDQKLLRRYIARLNEDHSWEVVFGKPAQTGDGFVIAYAAHQIAPGSAFVARRWHPFRVNHGYYWRASLAVDTAAGSFRPAEQRPYSFAVIPEESGEWWVYAYPSAERTGSWPLGGDTRFRVSSDGRSIVEQRQLHRAIVELSPAERNPPAVLVHSHNPSCAPEDTDVLAVLAQPKPSPMLVVCAVGPGSSDANDGPIFEIDANGELARRKAPP